MALLLARADVRNGFAWSAEFQLKVKSISPYPQTNGAVPPDGIGFGFDSASNRINSPGYLYDAAGNQTRALIPGSTASQRFQYDAANRLVKVKNDSGATTAIYTYGDSKERLISQDGDENSNYRTYYVGEGGSVTAAYTETPTSPTTPSWSKSYVYLGGRLLSTLTPNGSGGESIEYDHPDRLGTRLVTNPQNGTSFEQVTLPFGTALSAESTGQIKRRFTSYDRSDTTGLDYAVNRHYDPQQGRFTQVDPIGMRSVSRSNPQTLNLYAYCMNDPINHIDSTGLGFFSFLRKVLNVIHKVLKILMIAALVAIAIIVFAPASSLLFSIASWAFLHIFTPMAGLIGLNLKPAGTPFYDPRGHSTWGNGFQDQGPIFTCRNPPDCQNDIPALPPEVMNIPISFPPSIWSRVSRGIGSAVGSISLAIMAGTIKFNSYFQRYDAWVQRGIRGIDQRAAENSIIRGQTITMPDGRTVKTPDMIIGIPGSGGLQTVSELEYSEAVLLKMEADPAFHGFPYSFEQEVLKNGTKTVFSPTYVQYTLRGYVNGRAGTFEVGVNPATNEITHRFFRP